MGKDILGSVRATSDSNGVLEERYEYDAFGSPYKGDLTGGMNLGYTGKPYDAATGMYNYGYRDYAPSVARFTTVDPIRDGSNWFAYVNNDPVNYVDLWGLLPFLGGTVRNNSDTPIVVMPEDSATEGTNGSSFIILGKGGSYSGPINGVMIPATRAAYKSNGMYISVSVWGTKGNYFFSVPPIPTGILDFGGDLIKLAPESILRFFGVTNKDPFTFYAEGSNEGIDGWWALYDKQVEEGLINLGCTK